MKDQLEDYKERHRFWTNTSVTQLSTTNNLLLTISTGFLAFCFDKKTIKSIINDTNLSYNWSLFFYFFSLTLIAISITLGIGVLFCRLYDFRISRHLALTRKRYFKIYKEPISIGDDSQNINLCHRLSTIYQILFRRLDFINKKDIENKELATNFKKLKRLSKVLGSASWKWTKTQVLLFFSSVICYVLYFWSI